MFVSDTNRYERSLIATMLVFSGDSLAIEFQSPFGHGSIAIIIGLICVA